ncbi:MAG: restriction endonuclease [Alphaproteobacteria bacterium]|nr:restriction endonuclease [Alphaproteobacteria bacterium]
MDGGFRFYNSLQLLGSPKMARRKRRNKIQLDDLLRTLVIFGGPLLAIYALSKLTNALVEEFCVLTLFVGFLVILSRRAIKQRLAQKITCAVNKNIYALVRKQAQLLHRDDYGKLQPRHWHKEIGSFFSSQIIPELTKNELTLLRKHNWEWTALVDRLVCEAKGNNPAFDAFSPKMSPTEFEVFCADELQRVGWDARVTKASRDQGVDVVAQKKGIRLVVQCKLYNQPVGNKAVQEVVAARAHESAQFGAVVSNNRYTAQAQQLANTNQVALLHYSDLRNIDALVSQVLHPSAQSMLGYVEQGQR